MAGRYEAKDRLMYMTDEFYDLLDAIEDRYTAEELVELLGLTTRDVIEMAQAKIMRTDWTELL